jgi:hypothetical protein
MEEEEEEEEEEETTGMTCIQKVSVSDPRKSVGSPVRCFS